MASVSDETIPSDPPFPTPRPPTDVPGEVPGTAPPPIAEPPRPPAVEILNHVVRGAHDAIDRLADNAEPAVRRLGEGASAARAALRTQADRMGETRDEWAEMVRAKVRSAPLVSVAFAALLGAILARVRR